MEKFNIIKTIYEIKKDLIYEFNTNGYFFDEDDFLIYSTFFTQIPISATLNVTSKYMCLLFDGEKNVEEVFNYCVQLFEGVKKDQLMYDLISFIHKLERLNIIYSDKLSGRRDYLKDHRRMTFYKNMDRLRKSNDLLY